MDRNAVEKAFHEAHDRTFGHAAPGEPVELVNLRLAASLAGAQLSIRLAAAQRGAATPRNTRQVFLGGRFVACPVYDRAELPLDVELAGPLVVEEPGSSTIVWPRDQLRVDVHGNFRIQVGEK
jgi:N-methylhydantoinase A